MVALPAHPTPSVAEAGVPVVGVSGACVNTATLLHEKCFAAAITAVASNAVGGDVATLHIESVADVPM